MLVPFVQRLFLTKNRQSIYLLILRSLSPSCKTGSNFAEEISLERKLFKSLKVNQMTLANIPIKNSVRIFLIVFPSWDEIMIMSKGCRCWLSTINKTLISNEYKEPAWPGPGITSLKSCKVSGVTVVLQWCYSGVLVVHLYHWITRLARVNNCCTFYNQNWWNNYIWCRFILFYRLWSERFYVKTW